MRRSSLQGVRILVVDDEEMLREVVVELLQQKGCVVSEASSGNKAFEKLKAEDFDVLLTDVRMPDGDGLRLIQRLCDELPHRRPQILVCSGFSDVTTEMVRDLRIARILQKPFTMTELVDILMKLI